jgi:hypothetical protein
LEQAWLGRFLLGARSLPRVESHSCKRGTPHAW